MYMYIYSCVTVGAPKGSFHLTIKHINSIPARPVNENMKICHLPTAGCRFVGGGGIKVNFISLAAGCAPLSRPLSVH